MRRTRAWRRTCQGRSSTDMADETLTPAQIAQNEAARQAVMLVFGLVTAVIFMQMQRKMQQEAIETQRNPDIVRTSRMEEAKRIERMWSKVGSWTLKLALKVADRAWKLEEKARQSYEKDRA